MAVTTQNSTQVENYLATVPAVHNPAHQWHGRLRIAFFEHAQDGAGDAGSIARLVRLPAGKVRLLLPLSFIGFSAMGASRTLDLGWEAYTDDDGSSVAADPNGLDDGVDVSSAGTLVPAGTLGGSESKLFESREGVVITGQINDGTFPDAGTLKGFFVYVVD